MTRVEEATGELKRLVGWGADWRRVAVCPILRQLAGATDIIDYRRAGTKVMDYIITSISELEGPWDFHGRRIDAHRMKWALRLLLKIEGAGSSAPCRRFRAIRALGLSGHTPQAWRRDPSPERDLLRLLAEQMCGIVPPNLQAA